MFAVACCGVALRRAAGGACAVLVRCVLYTAYRGLKSLYFTGNEKYGKPVYLTTPCVYCICYLNERST